MSNLENNPIEVTALELNYRMKVHKESELLSNIIRDKKRYSLYDLVLFQQILRQGGSFLDAGANIGWYSLYAANKVGPQGHVYAFEPDQKNADLLRENIQLNHLTQIEVIQKALTEKSGQADIFVSADNRGDNQVRKAQGDEHSQEQGQVETVCLDEYLSPEEFQSLQFIKIDIQGCEPQMLAGMKNQLQYHRPPILIEYSPSHIYRCGNSPFEIFAFIEKHRYIPYRVHDEKGSLPSDILEPLSVAQLFNYTGDLKKVEYGIDLLLVPEGYHWTPPT